jgi:hypothetical protein
VTASLRPFAGGAACLCDWEHGCGGLGVLRCAGCGGDQCVCRCGGEMECHGCQDCADVYEDEWADYMRDALAGKDEP